MNHRRRQCLQTSLSLAGLSLVFGCGLRLPALAQPPPPRRIGYLSTNAANPDPFVGAFRSGLQALGWIEGENLTIEYRYTEGDFNRLPQLAADLVERKVEVIHASSTPSALAARDATKTIPIVTATTGDPIAEGLVASLSRPGGNVTGLTSLAPGLTAKRVELLTQIVPGATRLGVLKNATATNSATYNGFLRGVEAAAETYHLDLRWAGVSRPDPQELAQALAGLMQTGRPDILLVLSDPVTLRLAEATAALALQYRLPTMANSPDAARTWTGLLIGYGPSIEDAYRRSAAHVDKLLKGANPADLPIEQPSFYELVVNLTTAQALGLTLSPGVLAQATEVIP